MKNFNNLSRLFLAMLITLVVQQQAHAQLEDRLQSKAIRDYLVLTVEKPRGATDKQLMFATNASRKLIHGMEASNTVLEKKILRSDNEFAVVVPFSNPFNYEINVNVTTQPDPQNESVPILFEALKSLYNNVGNNSSLPQQQNSSLVGSAEFTDLLPKIKSSQLLNILQLIVSNPRCNPGSPTFEEKLAGNMVTMEQEPAQFSTMVNTILNNLTSKNDRASLTTECATALSEIPNLEKKIKDMNQALTNLKSDIASIPTSAALCAVTKLNMAAHAEEYGVHLQEKNKIREALLIKLKEIIKELQENHLQNDDIKKIGTEEYAIIKHISVGSGEQVTIDVTQTELKNEIKDDVLVISKGKTYSGKFIVYRKGVAFDFSTGPVLTNLEFVTYGTSTNDAGQLIVADPVKKRTDVLLPAMLNVYPYLNIAQLAPFFQIGVSPTRERPALLGGIGVRLLGLKHIAISFGGVTTWQSALNGLELGQTVSGTAEIEEKTIFKLSSELSRYIGISYVF